MGPKSLEASSVAEGFKWARSQPFVNVLTLIMIGGMGYFIWFNQRASDERQMQQLNMVIESHNRDSEVFNRDQERDHAMYSEILRQSRQLGKVELPRNPPQPRRFAEMKPLEMAD